MGRYMLVVAMIIYLFLSLTSSKQWCAIQLQAGEPQRALEKSVLSFAKSPNIIFSWKEEQEKMEKKRRCSFISSTYCNVPSCWRNTKLMQSQPLLLHPRNALWPWLSTMTRDFNCLWLMDSDMKLLKISCYTCCAEMRGFSLCWEGENPKHKPLEPPSQQSLEFCPEALWARK